MDALTLAAAHLAQGEGQLAAQALLPALDRRACAGDRECELAAALLRLPHARPTAPDGIPAPPDPLSAMTERLVTLVRRQEDQIRSLQDLVEALL